MLPRRRFSMFSMRRRKKRNSPSCSKTTEFISLGRKESLEIRFAAFWVMSILVRLLFWIKSEERTFKREKLEVLLSRLELLCFLNKNWLKRSRSVKIFIQWMSTCLVCWLLIHLVTKVSVTWGLEVLVFVTLLFWSSICSMDFRIKPSNLWSCFLKARLPLWWLWTRLTDLMVGVLRTITLLIWLWRSRKCRLMMTIVTNWKKLFCSSTLKGTMLLFTGRMRILMSLSVWFLLQVLLVRVFLICCR